MTNLTPEQIDAQARLRFPDPDLGGAPIAHPGGALGRRQRAAFAAGILSRHQRAAFAAGARWASSAAEPDPHPDGTYAENLDWVWDVREPYAPPAAPVPPAPPTPTAPQAVIDEVTSAVAAWARGGAR